MSEDKNNRITYKDAGVDIDAGNKLIDNIKDITKSNQSSSIGGFAALFDLPEQFKKPVLVSCTDGVGTKLTLAHQAQDFSGIGIDLVAMCANDLIVCGATPLFFLDYYATGKLDVERAAEVIQGIQNGCQEAKLQLIGGETAEMPGMYQNDDFDLAGFSVGVVEKDQIIDGKNVTPGDVLIGLASSGPHSNGYSLIRKILEVTQTSLEDRLGDKTFGQLLSAPTKLYVKPILNLMSQVTIKAMAHITGGGLPENIDRTLPKGTLAKVNLNSWKRPAIFDWLQEKSGLEDKELLKTFNCGIGYTICVAESDANKTLEFLASERISAWQIGRIEQGEPNHKASVVFE